MPLKPRVFGKKIVVNLHTKRGYRVSPGKSAKNRAIADCVRKVGKGKGKEEQRYQCFRDFKHTKNDATSRNQK